MTGCASGLGEQASDVERVCHHQQLTVAIHRPFVTRPVAVQLDAVAVRIAQVDGLADPVVAGAIDRDAQLQQVLQRPRQVAARG